jgi:NAD-dependent histone deacetylase SIR2
MDTVPAAAGEEAGLKLPLVDVAEIADVAAFAEDTDTDASNLESGSEDEPGDEWESESLYEDAIQFIGDGQLREGGMKQ